MKGFIKKYLYINLLKMNETKNQDVENKLAELKNKKELQKKVLTLIPSSRMSIEEKKMWIAMLPYMEDRYVIKLIDILERETNEFATLYINALNSNI
ncbi:MAG: hypothetical protein WCG25_08795 [bacterium]